MESRLNDLVEEEVLRPTLLKFFVYSLLLEVRG